MEIPLRETDPPASRAEHLGAGIVERQERSVVEAMRNAHRRLNRDVSDTVVAVLRAVQVGPPQAQELEGRQPASVDAAAGSLDDIHRAFGGQSDLYAGQDVAVRQNAVAKMMALARLVRHRSPARSLQASREAAWVVAAALARNVLGPIRRFTAPVRT